MRVLVVDAAAPSVAVAAIVAGEGAIWWRQAQVVYGADGFLSVALGEALAALGGVDRVAVTVGPGAFTGLRVGVATALGLALARGVGVCCLSSLELRAGMFPGGRTLALLDARKDRVYAGLYEVRAGERPALIGQEEDISPAALAGRPEIVGARLVGDGAIRYRALWEAAGLRVEEPGEGCPAASAYTWIHHVAPQPVQQVALKYLREPDAKIPPGLPGAGASGA